MQGSMTMDTWQSFINQAELSYIIPVLGAEFYDEIKGEQTQEAKIFFKKVLKISLANYAYLLAIPQMLVSTSDSGIQQAQPGTTGHLATPLWMATSLVAATTKAAEDAMENAMAYLEAHLDDQTEDEQPVFKTYLVSENYIQSQRLLIKSATEMSRFFPPMQNSRRMFLALKEYLKMTEAEYLIPNLGVDFYRELKAWTLDSEPKKHVMDLAKYAMSYYAVNKSLEFLNVSGDFRLLTMSVGINTEAKHSEAKVAQLRLNCEQNATRYMNMLRDYLDDTSSVEVFKTYFDSKKYTKKQNEKGSAARVMSRFDDTTKNYVML